MFARRIVSVGSLLTLALLLPMTAGAQTSLQPPVSNAPPDFFPLDVGDHWLYEYTTTTGPTGISARSVSAFGEVALITETVPWSGLTTHTSWPSGLISIAVEWKETARAEVAASDDRIASAPETGRRRTRGESMPASRSDRMTVREYSEVGVQFKTLAS